MRIDDGDNCYPKTANGFVDQLAIFETIRRNVVLQMGHQLAEYVVEMDPNEDLDSEDYAGFRENYRSARAFWEAARQAHAAALKCLS